MSRHSSALHLRRLQGQVRPIGAAAQQSGRVRPRTAEVRRRHQQLFARWPRQGTQQLRPPRQFHLLLAADRQECRNRHQPLSVASQGELQEQRAGRGFGEEGDRVRQALSELFLQGSTEDDFVRFQKLFKLFYPKFSNKFVFCC